MLITKSHQRTSQGAYEQVVLIMQQKAIYDKLFCRLQCVLNPTCDER